MVDIAASHGARAGRFKRCASAHSGNVGFLKNGSSLFQFTLRKCLRRDEAGAFPPLFHATVAPC